MVTLDTSLPPFGSGSFPAVLLTVLVMPPAVVTVATNESVVEAPLEIAPMFQIPVLLV
jgi:hypothetical protein